MSNILSRHTDRAFYAQSFLLLPAIILFSLWAVGCQNEKTKTPLTAAINGDLKLLKQLDVQGVDLNAQYPDHFNWTPLIASIYFQNTNIVAYLLDRGVDVSKRDGTGQTALMMAIIWDDTNTGALLLKKAPQAIRQGEDWTNVFGMVQVTELRNEWHAMLNEFQRTNTINPAKPWHVP